MSDTQGSDDQYIDKYADTFDGNDRIQTSSAFVVNMTCPTSA
ncbi:hypothetical protein [Acinetobacter sp. YH12049]|nr:hypothetical protein [Acinetobacter sp. YH12049]